MGEAQLFESTIISGTPTLVNGAEIQNGDMALVGKTAGLADDRAIAEFLRLAPFTGSTIARAILPYDISGVSPFTPGTVQPTGSANGSVLIFPFRAIIGSRTALATSSLDNWRDIRSGIFMASLTTATLTQPLAVNSSGNPRWDLIYATITVDAPTNQVQRRVKDPSTSAQSVQSVYQYLSQPVSVSVQAGTPSATPSIPSLPADSGSSYNIPLAAVRVVSGFSGTSTVLPDDIRSLAPCAPLARSTGATSVRMANGNNDGAGTYATNFAWPVTTGVNRPAVFLPPTMVGGEQIVVQIDSANPAAPSHANNSIIDSSVDWTGRFFMFAISGSGAGVTSGAQFATAPGTGFSSTGIPEGGILVQATHFWQDFYYSHSMRQNVSGTGVQKNLYVAGSGNSNSVLTGSMTLGVKVDYDSGQLRCVLTNSPVARLWLWIMASAQYPNF